MAHGLAETQRLPDGNKRTTLVALTTLLAINGYDIAASDEALAFWILALSPDERGQRRCAVEDLESAIRAHAYRHSE